jgi:hypothetical protein
VGDGDGDGKPLINRGYCARDLRVRSGNDHGGEDLVVILQGSKLLVDDLYCTGGDRSGGDVYASGWLNRSVCTP